MAFFSPSSLTIRSYWSDKATFKFLLRLCHSYLKVTHSTIKLIISMHLKASHVTNIWWSQPTSVDVLVFFPCLMSVDLCLPPACVTERFCSGFGLFVLPSGLVPGSIVIACGASTLLHFQHPLYLLSFKSFLLNCSWLDLCLLWNCILFFYLLFLVCFCDGGVFVGGTAYYRNRTVSHVFVFVLLNIIFVIIPG